MLAGMPGPLGAAGLFGIITNVGGARATLRPDCQAWEVSGGGRVVGWLILI